VKRAVFTTCTAGSLPGARLLERQVTDAAVRVVRVDEDWAGSRWMAFRYTAYELVRAWKPWVFEELLAGDWDAVAFVGADCGVYSGFDEAWALLDDGAVAVVVPHLVEPLTDGKRPSELDFLRSGSYALSFVALRRCEEARRFVAWWKSHLERDGIVDPDAGYFADQRWFDLVPGLFEGVRVLRHPGYNVGFSTVKQRPVRWESGWRAGRERLVYWHYGALNAEDPGRLSPRLTRVRFEDLHGDEQRIVREYAAGLMEMGWKEAQALGYRWGEWNGGGAIPDELRRITREYPELEEEGWDPFEREAWRELVARPGMERWREMLAGWGMLAG
jgi:hypothetical protein